MRIPTKKIVVRWELVAALLVDNCAIVVHSLPAGSHRFQDAAEVVRGHAVNEFGRPGHAQVVDVRRPALGIVEPDLADGRFSIQLARGAADRGQRGD